MDKGALLMSVTIDCPVCSSSNYFSNRQLVGRLLCRDCGFVLSENALTANSTLTVCFFCENDEWFYYESPFGLNFLGRNAICHVCEAQYKNTRIDHPELRFNADSQEHASRSTFAEAWRNRINIYLNNQSPLA
jgi:hypothetical protein